MKTVENAAKALLRTLPSVEKLLAFPSLEPLLGRYRRSYMVDILRAVLTSLRQEILAGAMTESVAEAEIIRRVHLVIVREDRSPLPFGGECDRHDTAHQPRAGIVGAGCSC